MSCRLEAENGKFSVTIEGEQGRPFLITRRMGPAGEALISALTPEQVVRMALSQEYRNQERRSRGPEAAVEEKYNRLIAGFYHSGERKEALDAARGTFRHQDDTTGGNAGEMTLVLRPGGMTIHFSGWSPWAKRNVKQSRHLLYTQIAECRKTGPDTLRVVPAYHSRRWNGTFFVEDAPEFADTFCRLAADHTRRSADEQP